MNLPKNTEDFSTRIVHSDARLGVEYGGVHQAIFTSAQYGFERVEDLVDVFQGKNKKGFVYARQGSPTTAYLEHKLADMEDGIGAVCFSTGMAAIAAVLMSLLKCGDHVVVSQHLFGNTSSLFETLGNFGVKVSRIDMTSVANVASSIRSNTRLVFSETVANPGTQVTDFFEIGKLCKIHGILFVLDNTVLSPYLFRPKEVGVDLVVHSLTKTIGGHGNVLGGAVIDCGLFNWSKFPNIFDGYRKGDTRLWGLTQIRKKGLRDMGGTLSSESAHLISTGAETLALRLDDISGKALKLAGYFEAHPRVKRVNYPFLPSHPQHGLAAKWFKAGSWLMSIELADPNFCFEFLNRLKSAIRSTGLADNRTLVIPVAHTIFWEVGAKVRAEMGISDGLIRISVGLENVDDLISDFEQALGTIRGQ